MDATKKFEKLVTDKNEIEGFPATALGMAAQTALSKVFQLYPDEVSLDLLFILVSSVASVYLIRGMKMQLLRMGLG